MNIICNNCVGARLYEVTHQQFPNPFMWMAIDFNNYIKLVEQYDKIDFTSPKFSLEYYKLNEYKSILITLNNEIELHYIHYIQDDSKDSPIKEKNTNILYNDILRYAKEKWFSRLGRSKEEPLFIYSFNYTSIDDDQYLTMIDRLFEIKEKKLLIILHEGIEIHNEIPENIKLMYCSKEIMELNGTALANALKEKIFTIRNV